MRNKYNRQQQHQIRSTFLPMLCSSSSNKQVKLSHRRCSSSSSTLSEDPSSPKVGCMGQVKRNNKVVGFPTIIGFITTTTNTNHSTTITNSTSALKNEHKYNTNTSSISIVKYHKLKSFFSNKSLTNSPATTTAASAARGGPHKAKTGGRNVDHEGRILCKSKISHEKSNHSKSPSIEMGRLVNLEELDPPLPVVKRVPKPEEVEEEAGRKNLWKRRSGGAPLKSLQVQVIHQSNPANTV